MTSHHGQAESPASSYRQAFDRIRAEYLEMRGMCLTPQQVQRLTGVDVEVCTTVLEDLVRAKFLQLGADGTYLRAHPDGPARMPADRSIRSPSASAAATR